MSVGTVRVLRARVEVSITLYQPILPPTEDISFLQQSVYGFVCSFQWPCIASIRWLSITAESFLDLKISPSL